MQITLNQSEIEIAIQDYISGQGISISGRNVDVSLTAGRGPNGMSASIDIRGEEGTSPVQPNLPGIDSMVPEVEENVEEEDIENEPMTFGKSV